MVSPDIKIGTIPPHEIEENKKNGHGYWIFKPEAPAELPATLPLLGEVGGFTEVTEISQTLASSRSVLVMGAPGAGKSHLIRDMQTAAVVHNIPAFCLAMHVNGGSRQGPENAKEKLDEFREAVKGHGGLVILDNVDFLGYKGGKGKNKGRKAEYAQKMEPIIAELMADPDIYVMGTAHDDEWRAGRWTWQDAAIDEPATRALESFSDRFTFEGKMAVMGLASILRERNLERKLKEKEQELAQAAETAGLRESEEAAEKPEDAVVHDISLGVAAQVIRSLEDYNRDNFFHANHLDIEEYLKDPQAAIDKLEAGRTERRGQA